jgi:hypothetical protein
MLSSLYLGTLYGVLYLTAARTASRRLISIFRHGPRRPHHCLSASGPCVGGYPVVSSDASLAESPNARFELMMPHNASYEYIFITRVVWQGAHRLSLTCPTIKLTMLL